MFTKCVSLLALCLRRTQGFAQLPFHIVPPVFFNMDPLPSKVRPTVDSLLIYCINPKKAINISLSRRIIGLQCILEVSCRKQYSNTRMKTQTYLRLVLKDLRDLLIKIRNLAIHLGCGQETRSAWDLGSVPVRSPPWSQSTSQTGRTGICSRISEFHACDS